MMPPLPMILTVPISKSGWRKFSLVTNSGRHEADEFP